MEHECVICELLYETGCRCNFKKPPKAKRGGSIEIYTTIPRTIPDIMDEINKATPVSRTNGSKAIFKIQIHFVKESR